METTCFPMEIMKVARQSVAVALRHLQAWAAGLCGLAGPLHGLANQEMRMGRANLNVWPVIYIYNYDIYMYIYIYIMCVCVRACVCLIVFKHVGAKPHVRP